SPRLLRRPTLIFSIPITSLFFFNDTAPTEIYTLSLHDALPISPVPLLWALPLVSYLATFVLTFGQIGLRWFPFAQRVRFALITRSEEHTSELQSLTNLVCRLLLEKKKKHIQRCAFDATI